ncbi:MAG: polysaccharide deacetylase family protein [Chloroflexi bacterium]|nr:polysaccharide deacetylase family protein [Chloroflexota bacterium]
MVNPYLQKLGLGPTDRAVIFHADDIGMCEGSISAYRDLIEFGLLSSAAAMTPCPWFPAAAALCRELADRPHLDMGIHLALNSEWSAFRWGPLSTRDPASGLMDESGYFFDNTDMTHAQATVEAVRQELQTQIERGLQAGIQATHVDTHMFCLFQPRFLPIYLDVARQFGLNAFAFHPESAIWRSWHSPEHSSTRLLHDAAAAGLPLMDSYEMMSLTTHEDRLTEAKTRLDGLTPGLHYFLIHPVKDTPELRAMAPDWRCRVADYELFTSEAWRKTVQDSGVQVLGWKDLRL